MLSNQAVKEDYLSPDHVLNQANKLFSSQTQYFPSPKCNFPLPVNVAKNVWLADGTFRDDPICICICMHMHGKVLTAQKSGVTLSKNAKVHQKC